MLYGVVGMERGAVMTTGRPRGQQPATRYFIDDDGGYASGYGPMADALLKFPEWREVTKEEHDTAKNADPDRFGVGEDKTNGE